MDISFFIKGLIIGFSIAAPVGPIGVLCMQRTLAEGRVSGFVSGLGAATADAIYGSVAGFGLIFISSIVISHQLWIHLVGGAFLCYLGIKTFLSMPIEQVALEKENGLGGVYASTFLLTLTNPMTILSFGAIFTGMGFGSTSRNYVSAWVLVLGVFMGSSLWWFILSSGVSMLRSKFNSYGLRWINRLSGIIIVGFGLVVFLSLER